METEDENDLIILNPSWVLTEVVGNLFSQDSIGHARVTGSFTTDDLHFLITESDIGMVIEVLIALECCTICSNEKNDNESTDEEESDIQNQEKKQSIQSFFEEAVAGNTFESPECEEVQMEIPRLNLILPQDLSELWDNEEEFLRTGVQFRSSGSQLVHLFPRIQCRLRRTVARFWEQEGLEFPELIQWLHGSRLTFNKGLINIYIVCDELEEVSYVVKSPFSNKLQGRALSLFAPEVILNTMY